MSKDKNEVTNTDLHRRTVVTTLGVAAAAAFAAPVGASAAQNVELPKGAVTAVVLVRARAGKEADLIRATEALVPKVRQEAGNLLCQFHQGLEDPSLFVFYEIFETEAALEAHKEMPHVKQWSTDVESLMAEPAELKVLKASG
ncbi:putative quinol monooxygenase [Ensifer sp. 22521]|uniref:putative quinol monooxygenase n=1 Tax=Ensifer sp. 22521 TaxID=3453935 RepID=UPI003F87ED55